MTIRFRCPHCEKPLAVKDHLAGKKGACPVCKKALVIPAPVSAPADVEDLAAAALADNPAETPPVDEGPPKTIDFTCDFCDEELHLPLSEAGKKMPCPECRRIIRIPVPDENKPKDWRELIKKGPSAALINQPEQLDDAWGTEVKTRVSGTALAEAGALPEVPVQPVGIGGWIKRVFYAGLVVGVLVLVYFGLSRSRQVKLEKDAVVQLKEFLEAKDPMPPLLAAQAHLGIGEVHLRKNEAAKALDQFRKARAVVSGPTAAKDVPDYEADFFLIDLARAQIGMGGNDDQVIGKERYPWKEEVQKELLRTLEAMRSLDARQEALRVISSRLIALDQAEVAIALCANLAAGSGGTRSPLLAQQIALLMALGKEDTAARLVKAPDPKFVLGEAMPRMAYAEGQARKGAYPEALAFAQARGPAGQRLETSLGAASICLTDPKAADQSKPFLEEALKAYKDLKGRVSTWNLLLLVRQGCRSGVLDEAQSLELVKSASPPVKSRALLEMVRARLERAPEPAEPALLDPLSMDRTDKSRSHLILGWARLARHNARTGGARAVREAAAVQAESQDAPPLSAFVGVAAALGETDPAR